MTKETTIHNRPLTEKEKALMRRSHFVIIPVVLIAALIIWVVSLVDSLPQPARIAAYVIATGAVLIFSGKLLKLEKELKEGEAEVVRGVVENKYKFGGRTSRAGSGIGRNRSSSNRGQATFIIVIGGKKYWVRPKTYKKATKGAFSEMVWLPKSQYVVSIQATSAVQNGSKYT